MFVTGLEQGLVPISHAKTPEAMDEEQRLLYVALSRAERVLHLSWARERTVGGRTARRNPSTWLARVDDAIHPGNPSTVGSGDARQSIADARDRVARGTGGSTRTKAPTDVSVHDEPLYTALVDWRLRQSRAAERARVRHLPQHHPRRHRQCPAAAPCGRSSTCPASGR